MRQGGGTEFGPSERDDARAVAELLLLEIHLRQQADEEVGHRRVLRRANVLAALVLAAATTRDEDRKVGVIVLIAVAEAAAVEDERMIQQGAVAVGRLLQLVQEVREET